MGQTLRSGPFPQPGSRAARPQGAHNRRQAPHPGMQGSRVGPGTQSERRGATDRRPQNRAPGSRARRIEPRGAASSPAGLPPSPPRQPGPRRLPRCPARLPRGPVLPPRSKRALTRRRRPTGPVPDAQGRGSEKTTKKAAEKGTLLSLDLATFLKPSQSPVQPPPPLGRQGAQRAAGAQRPGEGAGWEAPRRWVPARTLKKSLEHRALDPHRRSVPSCPRRACPAPLSPSAWEARGALRVGPAPRPRLPPCPLKPRLLPRPEVAGEATEPREPSAETATARAAPADPAPDPTKRPAEGCRESGREKAKGTAPPGSPGVRGAAAGHCV